jgi:predicted nucleic acid-binding protein
MSVKAFLDTNIIVYLYSSDEADKRDVACSVLNNYDCVTSMQALNEACNVWIRKFKWDGKKINEHLDNIEMVCDEILPVQRSTITRAIELNERYGCSYFDCIMLASALECKCVVILTEDMNEGQIINGELTIVNPYKELPTE